ncbi:heme oxygenase (biliverdin-producing) [Streptomyces sp. NRRL F-5123]|uniref:biliverdin-producing heme oxygenase n=1 Tax=Streptomyces sp. NRRL F-5123 TaxID=1463856 RepID=UPI0004E1DFC2|nr:biliverdin-producing heme oxygenase [Streptomyces sp. NRRL F-5123]
MPAPLSGLTPPVPAQPFSAVIREAVRDRHTEAENSRFMADLLGGRLGVTAYARLAEQLLHVYRALEEGADTLAGDPVAGPFLRPELRRVPALERDLDHLLGPGRRERTAPLPATARYAARIARTAAEWPAGYIAHHYTRYLGDLSGGQVIRGIAEKTWNLPHKGDGVRFYVFEHIANPAAFKREYRELLDAVAIGEQERQHVVEECREAFRLNSELFAALGEEFPRAA